ncbi:S41 family peptidase [Kurthia senegalensis]|uniref:S41 family peptidase n=1 Tax=Kurthia senegalensis TaxID=1033740 RepID=UPI000288BC57|nr:S41 family peptidase [Kurthia senegalensis]
MKWKTLVTTVIATAIFTTSTSASAATITDANKLKEIKSILKTEYYPSISTLNNIKTLKDISKNVDPYTVYFSKSEYAAFNDAVEYTLVGIGVSIEQHKKGILIMTVFKGSPAEKAGLKAGDIITRVNGKNIGGQAVDKSSQLLKGEKNTKVTFTYYRPSTKKSVTKTVTRQVINMPNVETAMLAGNIAYIRLNSFSSTAHNEVKKAIQAVSKKANGYILDLRDNGGGDVNSAIGLIGFKKSNKVAFTIRTTEDEGYYATANPSNVWNKPLSILVNKNSASASEMTAAAYKDQKTAKIYGQKTYGKGVMQNVVEFKDGSAFKYTMAEFRGPNDKKIQGIGVTPTNVTAVNKEVFISHRDFLNKQLKNYTKQTMIVRSGTTKSITVKPTKAMNGSALKNAKVTLYQVGGKTRAITVKASNKQLTVTPKTTLKPKTSYYLKVVNAKDAKKGTYQYISIRK